MADRRGPKNDEVSTENEAEILDFIAAYLDDMSYPPTVREIGEHMGWSSPSTTHYVIRALVRKGKLSHMPGQPRTLRVLEV